MEWLFGLLAWNWWYSDDGPAGRPKVEAPPVKPVLRDADHVTGHLNPDGSGRGNWLAHSYADEVYVQPSYSFYRPTAREQFMDAVGCAASMAGILIGAVLVWLAIFGLFALAVQP